MADQDPPVAKYKLTVVITGNTHGEVTDELLGMVRGGYLLASDYEQRDTFDVYTGRRHSTLEHTNPDMTPERYKQELRDWALERKIIRSEK